MLDVQSLIKYLLEGLAVAAAAYYIPQKTANLKEIAMIAVTAAAVFAVLDVFAPVVSHSARQGAGFGIGYNITSGLEGFESESESESSEESESETDSEDEQPEPAPCDSSMEPFSSVL